jgi:hypothetical protein
MRRQSAGSAFGSRAVFADLFEGNADALGRAFPHADQPYDASAPTPHWRNT